jgi:hypothetical protein
VSLESLWNALTCWREKSVNSITVENTEQCPEAAPGKPTVWQSLSVAEQAFAAAYVENGYSLAEVSGTLSITLPEARKMLNRPDVRRAITEVQNDVDSIDFLNEKWVKTQLLKLFPKVMGEEAVPLVNSEGEEYEGRKFYPDISMRILEYVHPKTTAGKQAGNTAAVQVNIDMGAMGVQRLEVKAVTP